MCPVGLGANRTRTPPLPKEEHSFAYPLLLLLGIFWPIDWNEDSLWWLMASLGQPLNWDLLQLFCGVQLFHEVPVQWSLVGEAANPLLLVWMITFGIVDEKLLWSLQNVLAKRADGLTRLYFKQIFFLPTNPPSNTCTIQMDQENILHSPKKNYKK